MGNTECARALTLDVPVSPVAADAGSAVGPRAVHLALAVGDAAPPPADVGAAVCQCQCPLALPLAVHPLAVVHGH